jgi:hypothetical protein
MAEPLIPVPVPTAVALPVVLSTEKSWPLVSMIQSEIGSLAAEAGAAKIPSESIAAAAIERNFFMATPF